MAKFKGVHGMEKIMVNWDVQEIQYQKIGTCLEQACGLVTKAKLLGFEEKEDVTLLSKFHPLESQILFLIRSLEEAKRKQLEGIFG